MRIAVLGTGMVGRALAGRLSELGHEVTIGTRDVAATLARQEGGNDGVVYADWAREHPQVTLATHAEAVADAEIVVNATVGEASLGVLTAAGRQHLAGKVLVDTSNPLDFSKGMPPGLFVSGDDSLGERIQREFPEARVVKTLNTLAAPLMVRPGQLADGGHTVFVSGDDEAAKKTVTELLTDFGHTDVVDLGDITTARAAEMLLPLWLRLWGNLGTPMFSFKLVR